MPINPDNWHKLFKAVYEMNSAVDHAAFADAVVSGMVHLIAADYAVFQVLDRASGRIMTSMSPANPFTQEEIAYYTAHSEEMPLVAYVARTGDVRARRISDVISLPEWLESCYYHRCLKRLELPYCLALPIAVDASIVAGLSFNRRASDFTQGDCELLDAFGPHFRQTWRRHKNPWRCSKADQHAAQARFKALGLTPREAEALFWMTEGKQNPEIAKILGLQLGTVQEYVARILVKLDQENRHAATVFAIDYLRKS